MEVIYPLRSFFLPFFLTKLVNSDVVDDSEEVFYHLMRAKQQHKHEHKTIQEPRCFKEAFIRILPRDFGTFLIGTVVITCLIEFIRTGNMYMLLTASNICTSLTGFHMGRHVLSNKNEFSSGDDPKT